MLDLSFTLIFVSCCFCSLTGYCLYIMACHREPSLLPEDWTKVPLFRETSWSCPPVNGYKKEEINTFPSLYYPRLAIPGDICKTYGLLGLLGGSVLKDLPANAGHARDVGLIPGSGRSPGGGSGNLLQYSCLENSTDRESWRATVHGVIKESNTTDQLNITTTT